MKKFTSLGFVLSVVFAFVSTMSFAPLLTSCGGGGGGSSEEGEDVTEQSDATTSAFGPVQTTTTDSAGQVSFVGPVSGATIELTLKNSSDLALEGLGVDYVESLDGTAGMLTIYDPSGVYQTAVINVDSEDLGASGQVVSSVEKDFGASALIIVGLISTAYGIYSSWDSMKEIAENPPYFRYRNAYGSGRFEFCTSVNNIMNIADIGSTVASAGSKSLVTAGSKKAAEVTIGVGETVAGEVIQSGISYHLENQGVDTDANYCIISMPTLVTFAGDNVVSASVAKGSSETTTQSQSSRWDYVVAVTDAECSPDSNNQSDACSSSSLTMSSILQALPSMGDVDGDEDGYTPNEDDCNDNNKYIYPGAVEICGNDVDEDCDGTGDSCTAGASVEITSPGYTEPNCGGDFVNGICYDTSRALFTTATITASDMPSYAYVMINGRSPQRTSVQDNGDGTGMLISGNMGILKCNASGYINKFGVVVDDGTTLAAEEISYGCTADATDLLVILFWNQCGAGTELELFVKEPDGSFAYNDAAATSNGGLVTEGSADCYGPVYYTIADAPEGEYQMRVHYKSGASSPGFTLHVIPAENFDHEHVATGSISTAAGSAGTTAGFSGSGASWSTSTWTITKSSEGEWSVMSAE